ncbi:spermine/spermidine synthase domain-containing protein [Nocardioides jensenii]|uniref:spermine/spermidine synthase domain-containing protein n=1 Tax=Nocardioides jensenii TaxID=1843 RepID=UPI000AB917AD|nr:hypothetical protein [Nocardioides jensenii]
MEIVEIARVETERGEVVLRERREENTAPVTELRVNGVFVMDTLETSSERALATAALALVDAPDDVLVGGLGLGFTVAEVLADQRVTTCTVVELEQALVDWMRDGTIAHGPGLLADARLEVMVADVAAALAEAGEASYDLVLLDVDNGPGYLVHEQNAALYLPPFLEAAKRATRQVVAIWRVASPRSWRWPWAPSSATAHPRRTTCGWASAPRPTGSTSVASPRPCCRRGRRAGCGLDSALTQRRSRAGRSLPACDGTLNIDGSHSTEGLIRARPT